MSSISKFIGSLYDRPNTKTVFNPYKDIGPSSNLENYFNLMKLEKGRKILLVGEAPGYAGCKITGIPFTSGQSIFDVEHPLLIKLRNVISLDNIEKEPTSTIVWKYLQTKKTTPLFWNSFPFHPHPNNLLRENRKPTSQEILEGVSYLKALFKIFRPELILGLGRAGESCSKQAFKEKDIKYIRHPSNGGKSKFIEGMNEYLI